MPTKEEIDVYSQLLITAREAAHILGVTHGRVAALVSQGVLTPIKKDGRVTVFLRSDIEAYAGIRRPGGPRMREVLPPYVMHFEDSGSSRRTYEAFQRYRAELGTIMSVNVYFWDMDAVQAGYYLPSNRLAHGDLCHVSVPTLILRGHDGQELWLNGANCGYGGEGPRTTGDILADCGVDEKLCEAVYRNQIVKFWRETTNNSWEVATEASPYHTTLSPESNAHAYLFWDPVTYALVLLEEVDRWPSHDMEAIIEQYQSFIPEPDSVVVLEREQAERLGLVYPLSFGGPTVYTVMVRDRSGRQLWLCPSDLYSTRDIGASVEIKKVLSWCGIEPPDNSGVRRWLDRIVNKVPPVVALSRRQ